MIENKVKATQIVNENGERVMPITLAPLVLNKDGEPFEEDINKEMSLRAPAIKPTVSGNPIVTKDSADFPMVSLELGGSTSQVQTSGKNLLNPTTVMLTVYWRRENDEFITDGSQGTPLIFKLKCEAGQNVAYSLNVESPLNQSYYLRIKNSSGEMVIKSEDKRGTGGINLLFKVPYSDTFSFEFAQNVDWIGIIKKIQIELNSQATSYEPYTGGEPSPSPNYPQEVVQGEWNEISCTGKNLFVSMTEQVKKGVYLSEKNGHYVLNGTATESALFIAEKRISLDGIYTLSSNTTKSLGVSGAIIQVYSPSTGTNIYVNEIDLNGRNTMNLPKASDYEFRIRIDQGATYKDYIVKPQLELGSVATDYEPYKGFTETLPQKIQLSKWDKIKLIDGVWKVERGSRYKKVVADDITRLSSAYLGDKRISIKTASDIISPVSTNAKAELYCNSLLVLSQTEGYKKGPSISATLDGYTYIHIDGYMTLEEYRDFLNNNDVRVLYKTKTPTYELLPPEAQDLLNRIVTFYPNTVLSTNEGITLNLKYVADTKNYINQNYEKREVLDDLTKRIESLEKAKLN